MKARCISQVLRSHELQRDSRIDRIKQERADVADSWRFPQLRECCQKHGARFQAIDARWGVSEEASLDQRMMSICLQELKRWQQFTARTHFIVPLGDRYGWRALPKSSRPARLQVRPHG
jgi:hypothetical protein